ncbi:MAG: phytoene desaturase family protein, partial [Patescibacteria group bacterium]|nr:phytoene desaturase family protein [Patescibacteria group bacterium]
MIKKKARMSSTAIVIGGGISGLATAALLGLSGWRVLLFEKQSILGGRAGVLKKKGFSFDMGPSWYLMPEVFEKFFGFFGKHPSEYYELVRLEPRYQVYFHDGTTAVLENSLKQNIDYFESLERGAGKKLSLYLEKKRRMYDAVSRLLWQDIYSWKFFLNRKNIQDIITFLSSSYIWQSWYDEASRYFKDERLRKIITFPSVFLGGSPYATPSFYSVLSWADFGKGVWYPYGGIHMIVHSLEKLAREFGVEIYTDKEVSRIEISNRKVVGVQAGDEFWDGDVVVGATDLHHLEMELLPKEYRTWDRPYWQQSTMGISALLLYLGIEKRLKNVPHHILYFSSNWKENFSDIFDKRKIPQDPSFYVSVRSVTDRSIVPKNAEELFVLIPLGAGGSYTKDDLEECADMTIKKIEKFLGQSFQKSINVKELFGPQEFLGRYNAYQGTALGLAHTFGQSLWFRPGNKHM